jgi:hypothetical protein
VSAFQLDIDLGKGVSVTVPAFDKTIVEANHENDGNDQEGDDNNDGEQYGHK